MHFLHGQSIHVYCKPLFLKWNATLLKFVKSSGLAFNWTNMTNMTSYRLIPQALAEEWGEGLVMRSYSWCKLYRARERERERETRPGN